MLKRPVPLHFGIVEVGVDCWRQVADGTVWPDGVVVVLPIRKRLARMIERAKIFSLRSSSRSLPLKLSMKAFWVGLPGAM